MITTLRKEAFLIKDQLSGGNSNIDSQIDERDIIMVYRQEMRDVYKLAFYDRINLGGDKLPVPVYIASFNEIEVEEDEVEANYYIELPSGYIELPHNRGIIRVCPSDDPSIEIYRSNNPYVADGLPVSKMELNATYFIEGNRLKFKDENWKDWDTVNVKLLIPAPDTIGENDPLPIIPNQQSEIRRRVIEHFRPKTPQDLLNDGNPDRGVTKPE